MKSFEKAEVKILEIIKELSFPRIMGSKGEKDAQIYIFSKLRKMGFNPIVKGFKYYNTLIFIEKGVSIFSLIFFISQFFLILFNTFVITLIISMLFLILANLTIIILNDIHKFKFGKQFSSKNIICEKKSEKRKEFNAKMGLIIINANYDSGERKIRGFNNSNLQITLITITGFSFILTIFTSIIGILKLHPNFILVSRIFSLLGLSISIFTSIIFFLNGIEKSSKGVVDNASGCAVLLNLMDRLAEGNINLNWMDLQFLFSGAKEIGAWGTNSYVNDNLENFMEYKDIYVIDIDKIRSKISIIQNYGLFRKKSMSNSLNKYISHLAFRGDIQVEEIRSKLCYNKNFSPFLNKNIRICSFTFKNKGFFYEFQNKFDKINQKTLTDVSEFIFNIILSLDLRIRDKIESGE